jgi:hypothetical protein
VRHSQSWRELNPRDDEDRAILRGVVMGCLLSVPAWAVIVGLVWWVITLLAE